MRMILSAGLVLLSASMVGWAGPAAAQDGWGWSIIIPSVTGTDQLGLHLRDQMARQQGKDAVPAPSSTAPSHATAPKPEALRYTPSKARRTANLAGFVEKTRKVDPAGADDLQRLFASGDIIERIGGQLAAHDMRIDDVADAYTVWWITAWQATKGTNADTSSRTNEAVRGQSARALGSMAGIAGAGDATKQELTESLLIQTMLIEAAVEQAKGDPARLKAVGAAVRQGAQGMGIDLSTMTLTEQGFVLAG